MNLNPGIFKAYDVRGLYPSEVNEEGARAIGAAFVAYLQAKRIAVGRDMRLSSPALAAAFTAHRRYLFETTGNGITRVGIPDGTLPENAATGLGARVFRPLCARPRRR